MKKVIIYGIGDLAKQLFFYLSEDGYEVEAFCVDEKYKKKNYILEKKIITFEELDIWYSKEKYIILLAIGYDIMKNREILFEKIKKKGYKLMNYIHKAAYLSSDLEMGENNIILANVSIEPFVKIGNNNIIWSNVNICHNVQMGNHNFLAAQSLIGGFTKVGNRNFFGFNSSIIENLKLGNDLIIGAKSLVLSDILIKGKYYGIPCKQRGEK